MSTMTPPPHDAPIPPAPPERRCPRCGHALAPDQDWCLACGAAADTEVAEPRGWRVPIMLSGALVLLALLGIVLLIVALAGNNNDEVAQPTPTPSAAVPPAATPTPTVSPLPTLTPSPTTGPGATATPIPGSTVTPSPSPVSSFPGWTGGDGWTIIIESATTQAKAESAAQAAHANGETVGILKSDDYASLNAGYWVVFTGQYTTKQEAEGSLESVRAQHQDAYVRQIKS